MCLGRACELSRRSGLCEQVAGRAPLNAVALEARFGSEFPKKISAGYSTCNGDHKRKKVDTFSLADLGVESAGAEKAVGVEAPPARAAGQMVGSVEELVEKLATEAKVL